MIMFIRNRKGQVGIFVALIFQVIFVFFAMLINVGLVVHHKINLQQSVDIAAYYGAMKQAEILNVMAHVNFQIRQSWKLMAWRYRVLGTFGMEPTNSPGIGSPLRIQYPVLWPDPGKKPAYNPNSRAFVCNDPTSAFNGLTLSDVPFMCFGHDGFGDWISKPGGDGNETFCKASCDTFKSVAFSIDKIPDIPSASIFGQGFAGPVREAIFDTNKILDNICSSIGPITTQLLATYYGSYIRDTQNRKAFIEMLAKNLALDETKMLDLEGKLVFEGVQNTLKNNLTEANLASLGANSIKVFNGAEEANRRGAKMLNEIKFQKLLFFIMACENVGRVPEDPRLPLTTPGTVTAKAISLYSSGNELAVKLKEQLPVVYGDVAVQDSIETTLKQNIEKFNTIGFEKNPWAQVYYGVKASSEPQIPFLPLAKIKMHAVAFAKPFGGSIGPWYFDKWERGSPASAGDFDSNRVDFNLPKNNLSEAPASATALAEAIEYLFNYSTHVGDFFSTEGAAPSEKKKGGLANTDLVSVYHSMLANKLISDSGSSDASTDKAVEPKKGTFSKPVNWPKFEHWYHLATEDINSPRYDTLAAVNRRTGAGASQNTFERDIELTVVAPNQFDVTYYSIEPDFYNVYASGGKLSDEAIQRLADATETSTPPKIPVDHGNWNILRNDSEEIAGVPRDFSVRHQLQVTKQLFKDQFESIRTINGSNFRSFAFDVIASLQSSVLTGWTFVNLTPKVEEGFVAFPHFDGPSNKFTMEFGECADDKPDFESLGEITGPNGLQPFAPGNCISGGRSGYSVKLISSELVRDGKNFKGLGGDSTEGTIENPVPSEFFRF